MSEPKNFTIFVTHASGYDPLPDELAALWLDALRAAGGTPALDTAGVGVEWSAAVGECPAGWSVWGLAHPPRPTAEQAADHSQATGHEILISADGVEHCGSCVWPNASPQS